jgi:APA family basic amino acid/polyamine antiporter
MAAGLLSCISAMAIVGPRVYYAMAQDGCFFRGAAQVHSRWSTPVQAIFWQAGTAMSMVLTGAFESLIYYIGFALTLFAALAVLGLMRMRRRADWKRLPAVSWAYPLVPLIFLITSVWIVGYTLALRPRESALGILTVLAGVLVYLLSFRKTSVRSASINLACGSPVYRKSLERPPVG